MSSLRLDKWLWAARFFKTRSLASRACDLQRVRVNAQNARPSRDVRVGDMLEIRTESAVFEVEVLTLNEVRGPATVARTMYRETEESIRKRAEMAEQRRLMPQYQPTGEGRPSKRDRRRLDDFLSSVE